MIVMDIRISKCHPIYIPTVLYVRYHKQELGEDQAAKESDELQPLLILPEVWFLQRNPSISGSRTAGEPHHRNVGRMLLDLGF